MGVSRKKRQRNISPIRAKAFARLKKKLDEGPLQPYKAVIEPAGQVKMSEVLGDFVAPYRDGARTTKEYRGLLTLAIIAWNAALLTKAKQRKMVNEAMEKSLSEKDARLKDELKAFLYELIARKTRFFSQYTRAIVEFELTETRNGYDVSVASTLGEDDL